MNIKCLLISLCCYAVGATAIEAKNIIYNNIVTLNDDDNEFEAARLRAASEGRGLVVTFKAAWCPPCNFMDDFTYGNETIANYISENYVLVKVSIDTKWGNALRRQFGVEYLPTTFFMTSEGTTLLRVDEGIAAGRMLDLLETFNKPQFRRRLLTPSVKQPESGIARPSHDLNRATPIATPPSTDTENHHDLSPTIAPEVEPMPTPKPNTPSELPRRSKNTRNVNYTHVTPYSTGDYMVRPVANVTTVSRKTNFSPSAVSEGFAEDDFVENHGYDPIEIFRPEGVEKLPEAGFGVQVAFNTEIKWLTNYFNTKLKTIFKEGSELRVHYTYENNKKTYRLIAGTFQTREEANLYRDTLRKKGLKDCFVVDFTELRKK